MIGVTSNIPCYPELTYKQIRSIRLLRNKTQMEWAELMGIDQANLSRLECGEMELSPIYYERLKLAMRKCHISRFEVDSVRQLMEYRKQQGYR